MVIVIDFISSLKRVSNNLKISSICTTSFAGEWLTAYRYGNALSLSYHEDRKIARLPRVLTKFQENHIIEIEKGATDKRLALCMDYYFIITANVGRWR